MWKLKTMVAANDISIPFFNGNISDWDINKTYFTQWCLFYRGIFLRTEDRKPPEKLEEYDILLDEWLEKEGQFKDQKHNIGDNSEVIKFV